MLQLIVQRCKAYGEFGVVGRQFHKLTVWDVVVVIVVRSGCDNLVIQHEIRDTQFQF